jgi:antitoxin MazE
LNRTDKNSIIHDDTRGKRMRNVPTKKPTHELRGTSKRGLSIRVAKWGNCMAVRIPREKALETGLKLGTEVSVEKVKDGVLIRPVRRPVTLKELVAKITPQNRHGEIDLGKPVGKEIV